MGENKVSLLCTRPLPEHLVEKALENNLQIDVIPFIQIEPITDGQTIGKIQSYLSKKITAIFTSSNAVEALSPYLTEKPDWDIYCIGGVTKESVVRLFGEDKIKGKAKNAVQLAEKIISKQIFSEMVFFCSDHRLDSLPGILKKNQVHLKEVNVYKTITTPKYIDKEYDGILFFSPSAVHSFFAENTINTDVILFAIGRTTTATIATYVMNTVISSEWPKQENLMDMVINHYNTILQKHSAKG
jgi:uroporphyrinogen-III synthase